MSVFRRALCLDIQSIKQIGQIVGVVHVEIGLPAALYGRRRIRDRVPHAPARFQHSHLVAHERSLAQ